MRSQGTGSKYLRTWNLSRRVTIKIEVYNFWGCFCTSNGEQSHVLLHKWTLNVNYTECQHTPSV